MGKNLGTRVGKLEQEADKKKPPMLLVGTPEQAEAFFREHPDWKGPPFLVIDL